VSSLVKGKHYLIDMSGASSDINVALPAGESEAAVRVSVLGNATNIYRVTLNRAGSDTIKYNGSAGLTGIRLANAETWVELSWDGTQWVIDCEENLTGGQGLVTQALDLTDFTGSPKTFTAYNGRHYLVDMAGAAEQYTIVLPAGFTETVVRISVKNNDLNTYPLKVDGNGTEKIWYDSVENADVYFGGSDQWAEFSWDTKDSHWIVNDGTGGLGGYVSGPLTVTGAFTPSGGIVGKTDGVAVAEGYIGETKVGSLLIASRTTLTNSEWKTVTSVTVKPGKWELKSIVGFSGNGGAVTGTRFGGGIGTADGNASGGIVLGGNAGLLPTPPTAACETTIAVPSDIVTPTVETTYFLKAYAEFSSGTVQAFGRITAERIA
jgi:hypothetical protein